MSLCVHADWSVEPGKRWMCVAEDGRIGAPEPVGPPETLLARLLDRAAGEAVAFGIDCPIGLPRAYAERHATEPDFPGFLRGLAGRPEFFNVARVLEEVGRDRPFYPKLGLRGMTRASHAAALGLASPEEICRACDRATAERPAGAPLFWTLGANQSGKAAIAAWRDMLIPARLGERPPSLWPFDGPFRSLLRPDHVAIAETYPAEALRQLGLQPAGSKRRQSDRAAHVQAITAAMVRLGATPTPALTREIADGFGPEASGEDRFDSLLGALCVLAVTTGARPDTAPDNPWILRWEGWVLGQTALPETMP